MAKTPTRRPPVPKDIKAGIALLDELAELRTENKDLTKANAALGREIAALQRKAAPKAKAAAK